MFIPEQLKVSSKKMTFRDTNQIIHGYQCINTQTNNAIIDCRIYTGLRPYSSRIIAAIWIHDYQGSRHSHGVGIACGYGYHKESQAIEEAIYEMGIKLDTTIGGCGNDACVKAFDAIMSALGYSSYVTAEFHA